MKSLVAMMAAAAVLSGRRPRFCHHVGRDYGWATSRASCVGLRRVTRIIRRRRASTLVGR
jgi:hypothetical protein